MTSWPVTCWPPKRPKPKRFECENKDPEPTWEGKCGSKPATAATCSRRISRTSRFVMLWSVQTGPWIRECSAKKWRIQTSLSAKSSTFSPTFRALSLSLLTVLTLLFQEHRWIHTTMLQGKGNGLSPDWILRVWRKDFSKKRDDSDLCELDHEDSMKTCLFQWRDPCDCFHCFEMRRQREARRPMSIYSRQCWPQSNTEGFEVCLDNIIPWE